MESLPHLQETWNNFVHVITMFLNVHCQIMSPKIEEIFLVQHNGTRKGNCEDQNRIYNVHIREVSSVFYPKAMPVHHHLLTGKQTPSEKDGKEANVCRSPSERSLIKPHELNCNGNQAEIASECAIADIKEYSAYADIKGGLSKAQTLQKPS